MDKRGSLIVYGEQVKLDSKDKKILKSLYDNCRKNVSEVEKETGLRRDSIVYRLKRLVAKKVIRSFTPILNPAVLGYYSYNYVSVILQNFTEDEFEAFLKHLVNHPNVTYVATCTGRSDLEIVITARDSNHYYNIMKDIRSKYSNIIKEATTSTIIQEHKYDDFTGLL
ncbi:Lrp/AsnC family transcriptional regulator [Candidatus Micrarchaeota archaeon]|nr:Lrp/AsnC family transcriptional regulator [Candidatus Micrarchaeota archaeon]